jgi:hypothetical protein
MASPVQVESGVLPALNHLAKSVLQTIGLAPKPVQTAYGGSGIFGVQQQSMQHQRRPHQAAPRQGFYEGASQFGLARSQGTRLKTKLENPRALSFSPEEVVHLISERRAAGLDGRFAIMSDYRGISSDFNQAYSLRPPAYDAKTVTEGVDQLLGQDKQADVRAQEAAVSAMQQVNAQVYAMQNAPKASEKGAPLMQVDASGQPVAAPSWRAAGSSVRGLRAGASGVSVGSMGM